MQEKKTTQEVEMRTFVVRLAGVDSAKEEVVIRVVKQGLIRVALVAGAWPIVELISVSPNPEEGASDWALEVSLEAIVMGQEAVGTRLMAEKARALVP